MEMHSHYTFYINEDIFLFFWRDSVCWSNFCLCDFFVRDVWIWTRARYQHSHPSHHNIVLMRFRISMLLWSNCLIEKYSPIINVNIAILITNCYVLGQSVLLFCHCREKRLRHKFLTPTFCSWNIFNVQSLIISFHFRIFRQIREDIRSFRPHTGIIDVE
jgi:hypothetical protein